MGKHKRQIPSGEVGRINFVVGEFASAMKEKMREKYLEGWAGWDNIEGEEERMERRLLEHAETEADHIDVANFCMMLWWNTVKGEYEELAVDERTHDGEVG